MNNFPFKVFVIAVAVAAPLEDTAEVAAAKEEFQALFDAAVAGDHAALAPVNNDVQVRSNFFGIWFIVFEGQCHEISI